MKGSGIDDVNYSCLGESIKRSMRIEEAVSVSMLHVCIALADG